VEICPPARHGRPEGHFRVFGRSGPDVAAAIETSKAYCRNGFQAFEDWFFLIGRGSAAF
jgi:hypothetical protein